MKSNASNKNIQSTENKVIEKNIFFNNINLFFVIAYLVIDFLPAFGSIEIIGTQYLYLALLNLIIGVYIFIRPTSVNGDILDTLKKNYVFKGYIVFVLLCLISVLNANNFSLWIVSFGQIMINFIMLLNIILLLYKKSDLIYLLTFAVGISVFAQTYSELYHLTQLLKRDVFFNVITQIKGNTGNINIFSASLNIKIPFLIFGILNFKDWRKWFMVTTLCLAFTLIFLLASRAAFIGLFLQIFIFSIAYYFINSKKSKKEAVLNYTYIFIPLIIAFLTANIILSKNKGTGRFESVTTRISQINIQNSADESEKTRLKYWKNAALMMKDNPFLGIGLGNWRVESLPYEKEYFDNLLVSEHTHNDFLQFASETGVINGLIFIAIFIAIFFINLKKIKKSNKTETKVIALIAIMILTGYAIDSMFNFPVYRPTVQMGFVFTFALTIINFEKEQLNNTKKFNKIWLIPILIFSFFTVYTAYHTYKSYCLQNKIVANLQNPKLKLGSDYIKSNFPKFPNVLSNSEPFSEILGIKLIQEKKYKEAQKYLNIANKINPYNGRIEWYKHKIAKENNKKDSAYIYAKQAFIIRPRNYDYYTTMLLMANEFKDTTEILKTHFKYASYVKNPLNWINTSNALHQSNYSKKNILEFIKQGILLFPDDSTLNERKKVFEYELNAFKPVPKFEKSNKKPVTPTEIYIYNLQQAANYGLEGKYDQSLKCYIKINQTNPGNKSVVQNIGICYFKLNQFKQAMPYLLEVLNEPTLNDGKTEFVLGYCYLNMKDIANTCKYLRISKTKNFKGSKEAFQQYCK